MHAELPTYSSNSVVTPTRQIGPERRFQNDCSLDAHYIYSLPSCVRTLRRSKFQNLIVVLM